MMVTARGNPKSVTPAKIRRIIDRISNVNGRPFHPGAIARHFPSPKSPILIRL